VDAEILQLRRHGSVRFLTNANASVTDTYEYDAFGNLLASTGTTPNNYLFAGEQFDPALGMYQMRARWYRDATGRFISRDPLEGVLCCGLSWNPYVYTHDDPVNRIDPSGEDDIIQTAILNLRVSQETKYTAIALYYALKGICGAVAFANLAIQPIAAHYDAPGIPWWVSYHCTIFALLPGWSLPDSI
jgi:RHS repeat-associated protein